METPETYEEAKTRRRRRTIVIVIAVIGLCCACVVAGIALYSWNAIQGGGIQEFPTSEFPVEVTQEAMTVVPDTDSDSQEAGTDPGEAPTGGLGNDILRNDTWQAVAAAAEGQGCDQPIGADSTIEVLQEPDAAGVWVEEWTVACASGDSYAYEVEYILDATGATFNIRSLP
jgi:hypothetical protein